MLREILHSKGAMLILNDIPNHLVYDHFQQ